MIRRATYALHSAQRALERVEEGRITPPADRHLDYSTADDAEDDLKRLQEKREQKARQEGYFMVPASDRSSAAGDSPDSAEKRKQKNGQGADGQLVIRDHTKDMLLPTPIEVLQQCPDESLEWEVNAQLQARQREEERLRCAAEANAEAERMKAFRAKMKALDASMDSQLKEHYRREMDKKLKERERADRANEDSRRFNARVAAIAEKANAIQAAKDAEAARIKALLEASKYRVELEGVEIQENSFRSAIAGAAQKQYAALQLRAPWN